MIQSLLRSMELLEVLKEQNRNFSIAELSESMNLPPSTIHRILQTFCEKKYVIRDDRSHTYRLGPALIPLGKAAARGGCGTSCIKILILPHERGFLSGDSGGKQGACD